MKREDNYTKNKIVEMMFGDWVLRSDGMEIAIKINNRKLIITQTKKGKVTTEEVAATAKWLDDKLMFVEKPRYYVKHADEFEMVFGELNIAPAKGISWEQTFERNYCS